MKPCPRCDGQQWKETYLCMETHKLLSEWVCLQCGFSEETRRPNLEERNRCGGIASYDDSARNKGRHRRKRMLVGS